MRYSRRIFFHIAAITAGVPLLSRRASAEAYPSRPVHMIADIPAGLAPDVLARLVGPQLAQRLGQDFVVEDRPGAGGNIGAEYVIRAAPDGYTLLVMISGNAANATLYPNLDFNFVRDIAPIAFLGYTPFVVVVNPSAPIKTMSDLIAYAKANPGKLNFASQGAGTAPHLGFELFRMMTDVNIVHVPYRVSYLPDLLAGQVQLAFSSVPPALGYIKTGKLRALGVTSMKRMEALPDVPAIAETLPGYDGSGWAGLGAPRGTPAEIIDTLNKNVNAVIADPAMKARCLALGAEPETMTPSQFGALIASAAEKWAKVIAFANIKVN
ncbi:MAG: tripartite tricarboxylate transporter substrate binding protein [Xanthobacteraceae bacterium]